MNDVIRYKIPEYLSLNDLRNFSLTCKEYRNILKEALISKTISERIDSLFPERIINMIGKDNLIKGDYVKWKDEWLGPTQYIDRVRINDVSNTISYGKDRYNRSFIFVRVNNIKNDIISTNLLTIFQRYTKGDTYVAIDSGGDIYHLFLRGRCSLSEGSLIEDISSLLHEKRFRTEKNDYYEEKEFFL